MILKKNYLNQIFDLNLISYFFILKKNKLYVINIIILKFIYTSISKYFEPYF
jgi:hypothetical protein